METTRISVNTDLDTKLAAQELFRNIGMDLSTAINIFLRRSILEQGIPFDVSARVPNSVTIAALDEYDEMVNHPEKYKRYASFGDALKEVL